MNHRLEINCQFQALNILSSGDEQKEQKAQRYCSYHNMIIPFIFRKIIDEYESNKNRLPTDYELIWLTSNPNRTQTDHGIDLTSKISCSN